MSPVRENKKILEVPYTVVRKQNKNKKSEQFWTGRDWPAKIAEKDILTPVCSVYGRQLWGCSFKSALDGEAADRTAYESSLLIVKNHPSILL